jgi:hypothetical protein
MNPHATLYIATPARHPVEGETVDALLRLALDLPAHGIEPVFSREPISGLVLARNLLAGRFRKHPSATHLLFVDSDVAGFTAADVARMVASGFDVIGGPVPSRDLAKHWAAMVKKAIAVGVPDEELHRYRSEPLMRMPAAGSPWNIRGHAIEVEAMGTGFLLLSRGALERMIEALAEVEGGAPPVTRVEGQEVVNVFDYCVDDEGTHIGEDYGFCFRWRALGGSVWADTRVTLAHVGREVFAAPPLEESMGIAQAREARRAVPTPPR